MIINPCPPREELQSYVECCMDEPHANRIADHLEACSVCEDTVAEMERLGDAISIRLRKLKDSPSYSHEPECQHLLQKMLEDKSLFSKPSNNKGVATEERPTPTNVHEYQIIRKLGQGGMGAVFLATHKRLKRLVALKLLPSVQIGDAEANARFDREMAVLGRLSHPNIVQAFDGGEHESQRYLAMEFVDGKNLSDVIRHSGPIQVADASEMIAQAALGLQYAHEHGVVHRDVKPSNLMLAWTPGASSEASPHVKILDLGLAKTVIEDTKFDDNSGELTDPGQLLGTLDYMAPEQGNETYQVDVRSDIYSLGATFYKLLSGEAPFAQYSRKPPMQRLLAMAQQNPPPILEKRPDIPQSLADIIHRMLAKQPEQRFSSMAEVIEVLAPFRKGSDLKRLLNSGPTNDNSKSDARTDLPTNRGQAIHRFPSNQSNYKRRRLFTAGLVSLIGLSVVLSIATKHGTVEVSSPDGRLPDDVHVVVSRNGIEVEVLQTNNNWSAKIVHGEYQLALRGGDDRFELENSRLVISRLGKAAIEVRIRPPNQPAEGIEPIGIASFPDIHAALHWLEQAGAEVLAKDAKTGANVDRATIRSRPETLGYNVHWAKGPIPPLFWKAVGHLPALRSVQISGPMRESDYINAAKFTKLQGFAATRGSDAMIARLATLKDLQLLTLSDSGFTDASLPLLKEFTNLNELAIKNTKVTSKLFDFLPPKIRMLRISGTAITGKDLAGLARVKHIGELTLSGDQLDEAGCKAISQLTFTTLSIEGSSPPLWRELRYPRSLEELIFVCNNAYEPDLKGLNQYPELKRMQFQSCKLTSSSIADLGSCPTLERIHFYHDSIDPEEVKKLRSRLPNCVISVTP